MASMWARRIMGNGTWRFIKASNAAQIYSAESVLRYRFPKRSNEREREREKNTERNLYKRHVNPIPVLECYPAQSRDQLRATKVHLSKVYDFSQRVGLSIISISILAAADAAKRATATSSSLLRFSSRLPLRL